MENFKSSPCCLMERMFPAPAETCITSKLHRLGQGRAWGGRCWKIAASKFPMAEICFCYVFMQSYRKGPHLGFDKKMSLIILFMGRSKKTITSSVLRLWNGPALFSWRKKGSELVMECWSLTWREVSESGYLFNYFSFVGSHKKMTGYAFRRLLYPSGSRNVSGLFTYDLQLSWCVKNLPPGGAPGRGQDLHSIVLSWEAAAEGLSQ